MGRIVFCYDRTGELSFTVNYTGCFIVNVRKGVGGCVGCCYLGYVGRVPHFLKLIVFKGNIWTKSIPVDPLRFLPDGVILNFFRVKFIKKLSNGLIGIHLIVPPNFFKF